MRKAKINRKTKETQISVEINLDGSGEYNINTGIGFLNHMIEQFSRHSLIDIKLQAKGDLHIDCHHTLEDTAIVLGEAILNALGEKKGIRRYGFAYVPMDEALTRCVIDLSGRIYPIWKVNLSQDKIGEVDTELFREWFIALASSLKCNLHIENIYGINNHHIIESCYKATAKALRMAIEIDSKNANSLATTKGIL